jgi:hypothetical protein
MTARVSSIQAVPIQGHATTTQVQSSMMEAAYTSIAMECAAEHLSQTAAETVLTRTCRLQHVRLVVQMKMHATTIRLRLQTMALALLMIAMVCAVVRSSLTTAETALILPMELRRAFLDVPIRQLQTTMTKLLQMMDHALLLDAPMPMQ